MSDKGDTDGWVLTTARLRLRELHQDDAADLHRVLGDEFAMAAYEHGFSRDETKEWIARQRVRYRAEGFGLWAMTARDDGSLLGDCGLTVQKVDDTDVIEVGYHLIRDNWHRGYATEAARACVEWAFDNLDTDAVYARVRDTNLPSMNVAIRLGMTIRQRFIVTYRGIRMPHLAFAVSRAQWSARAGE